MAPISRGSSDNDGSSRSRSRSRSHRAARSRSCSNAAIAKESARRDDDKSAPRGASPARLRSRSRSRGAAVAISMRRRGDVENVCAVCLESMECGPAPGLVRPYECSHRMHYSCAKTCLQWSSGNRCPICRACTLGEKGICDDGSPLASDVDAESVETTASSQAEEHAAQPVGSADDRQHASQAQQVAETSEESGSAESESEESDSESEARPRERQLMSFGAFLDELSCSRADFVNQLLQCVFVENLGQSREKTILDVLEGVNSLLLLSRVEPLSQVQLLRELEELRVREQPASNSKAATRQTIERRSSIKLQTRDGVLSTVFLDSPHAQT